MSVKILINKSQIPVIKPGAILYWDETIGDTVPADGKLKLEVIVVQGNSVYNNTRKLTLYVVAPFASLAIPNVKNRVPYGSQYQRHY